MLKVKLKKYFPPGADIENPLYFFSIGAILSALYSILLYLARLLNETQELYDYRYASAVIKKGAVMKDFSSLCEGCDVGFAILFLTLPFFAVYFYLYFHRESKPIYLMKRISSPFELHIRCLALPAAAMLICLILHLVLTLIYFAAYMLAVPEECLAPGQWTQLVQAIFSL